MGEEYGKPVLRVWQVEIGFWLDFFSPEVNNIDPAWGSALVDLSEALIAEGRRLYGSLELR